MQLLFPIKFSWPSPKCSQLTLWKKIRNATAGEKMEDYSTCLPTEKTSFDFRDNDYSCESFTHRVQFQLLTLLDTLTFSEVGKCSRWQRWRQWKGEWNFDYLFCSIGFAGVLSDLVWNEVFHRRWIGGLSNVENVSWRRANTSMKKHNHFPIYGWGCLPSNSFSFKSVIIFAAHFKDVFLFLYLRTQSHSVMRSKELLLASNKDFCIFSAKRRLASSSAVCLISAKTCKWIIYYSGNSGAYAVQRCGMHGWPLFSNVGVASRISVNFRADFQFIQNVVGKDELTDLRNTRSGSLITCAQSTFEACARVVLLCGDFNLFLISISIIVFFLTCWSLLISTAFEWVGGLKGSSLASLSLATGRIQC